MASKKKAKSKATAKTIRGRELAAERASTKSAKAFAARVAKARIAAGLTQRGLAKKLGRSQPCLCNLENGRSTAGPKLKAELCKALGIAA